MELHILTISKRTRKDIFQNNLLSSPFRERYIRFPLEHKYAVVIPPYQCHGKGYSTFSSSLKAITEFYICHARGIKAEIIDRQGNILYAKGGKLFSKKPLYVLDECPSMD